MYKVKVTKLIADTFMTKTVELPFVPSKGITISLECCKVKADKLSYDVTTKTFSAIEEPDAAESLNLWQSSRDRRDYNDREVRAFRCRGWEGSYNNFTGEVLAE